VTPERWDVFCRVVDNFGDAGVCWRLARLLVAEHALPVRLYIDDPATLARLHPKVTDVARQHVAGVEIVCWDDVGFDAREAEGVQVIVEAFGCGVPEGYLERAAAAARSPLWIVLEYLSAESWVPSHHGLPSPHPRLPLERYFFFPGFTPGTGGLLREGDLDAHREDFGAARRDRLWADLGFAPPPADALTAFVFAYPFAPLAELLTAWAAGERSIVAFFPDGALATEALRFFGADTLPHDRRLSRGALEARFVPFVPQSRFDALLWTSDVNFVRGEDSIVRAQWAAKPFVWHIYAQQAEAHRAKLEAFLGAYCNGLPAPAASAARELMLAWNQLGRGGVSQAWADYARQLPALSAYGPRWADRLTAAGELAANLAQFCFGKLK
jgi:uncharacterized repeat protein (TIGR03837 family)